MDTFLDPIFPVRCNTCGENLASRVDEYDILIKEMSPHEALESMGILNECTKVAFLTGGSKLIVTKPCQACVKGQSCLDHNMWHPTPCYTISSSANAHSQEDLQASSQQESLIKERTEEEQDAARIPVSDKRSTAYDSSHIFTVNIIEEVPKAFGIPVHLKQYDDIATKIQLDSGDMVTVAMGYVYINTL